MPVPDPKTGNLFVWLLSVLFFVAIITGGIFLLIYISLPESESTSWIPLAGFSLVGIPWSFWFLTIIYRCVSRGLGLSGSNINNNVGGRGGGGGGGPRVNGGGDGKNPGPLAAAAGAATTTATDDHNFSLAEEEEGYSSSGGGGRKVRFGGAIVVGETDGCALEDHKSISASSSANSNDDYDDVSSVASRESEVAPLRLSIQS